MKVNIKILVVIALILFATGVYFLVQSMMNDNSDNWYLTAALLAVSTGNFLAILINRKRGK
ncbi:MAG: hypothetical protein ACI4BC_04910 [Muribaculaceae bacterium]